MPIYEFHCAKCGTDSEILVRSSKWTGTPCPKCGSTNLSKKLSTFSASVASDPAPMCGKKRGSCCNCPSGGAHSH